MRFRDGDNGLDETCIYLGRRDFRELDLDDEEGDGDGEDPVADAISASLLTLR